MLFPAGTATTFNYSLSSFSANSFQAKLLQLRPYSGTNFRLTTSQLIVLGLDLPQILVLHELPGILLPHSHQIEGVIGHYFILPPHFTTDHFESSISLASYQLNATAVFQTDDALLIAVHSHSYDSAAGDDVQVMLTSGMTFCATQ
jgi:hypothetical protein